MHGTRPIEKRAPFFPKQSERFDGKARNFLAAAPYVGGDKAVFDRTNWASVRATWQGARAGEGINPKITARWAKSYEKLLEAAQPTTDIFRVEYSAPYHRRWLKATTAYLDLRRQGKVRNKQDATGGIAAAETAFNAFYDHLRAYRGLLARSNPRRRDRECPRCFFETPVLGFFWLWLLAALAPEPAPARRYPGNKVTLSELLSDEAIEASRTRDRLRPPARSRLVMLSAEDELELARFGPDSVSAMQRVIAAHRPLAWKVAYQYRHRAELEDLEQVAMLGLHTAWKGFKPEKRVRFSTIALNAAHWAIQDYLDNAARHNPKTIPIVQTNPNNSDEDSWEIQIADLGYSIRDAEAARLAAIALVIDRLDPREQRVVEARYCLTGEAKPQTLEKLGAELGVSDERVRAIEARAIRKLRKFLGVIET
jgi:RNA polymerase sigma factor (sigma-70 family)